jgi:hypothetical protein
MAKGDIQPIENSNSHGMAGALTFYVPSGTNASINPGEPVDKLVGANGVKAMPNAATPGTDFVVGVSASVSTETSTTSGLVQVVPAAPGQQFMIAPAVPATFATQAGYNAQIGKRVQFQLSAGVYTLLTTDLTQNMCQIEYLDVVRYPGMVAFSWNTKAAYSNV